MLATTPTYRSARRIRTLEAAIGGSNGALKLVEGSGHAPFAKAAKLFEGTVKKLSGDDVLGIRHEALEEFVNGS